MASEVGRVTRDQLVTLGDLQQLKMELLEEVAGLLAGHLAGKRQQPKRWMRSEEVKALLGISTGKLFRLRKLGILPYAQIDRVFLYDVSDVDQMLSERKIGTRISLPQVDKRLRSKKEKR
ncbi:helix-turn-helix transcriptional regulator [Chitinophaga tropicalis]|uniref:DNA-binding protein n=1 Tax=Chitinophaga tropicalis TaxID=2683588 RepID=A0A7K1U056_9BACT|nr:helix-turn-helix domain-containing protein [Chitinophaga tropicalis]MVT07742.1 DNA-binding protein [Chitinophaga tropicalis]